MRRLKIKEAEIKQIPMKPYNISKTAELFVCGRCDQCVYSFQNYCEICGQKIDWRKEDDNNKGYKITARSKELQRTNKIYRQRRKRA